MPDLWDLACQLADDRDFAEMELVGCVLAEPETLTAVAEAEGVSGATFAADDFRIFWLACVLVRDRGTVGVLRLAMAALKREPGCWDFGTPELPAGGRSCLWNIPRLAHLACSCWPPEHLTRHYARRLVAVVRRDSHIRMHLDAARTLLEGVTA